MSSSQRSFYCPYFRTSIFILFSFTCILRIFLFSKQYQFIFFFICLLWIHILDKISKFVISEGRNLDPILFLGDEYYTQILCLPLRKSLDQNFLGYLVRLGGCSFERWTFVKSLERSVIISQLRYWSRNLVKGSFQRRLILQVMVLLCPVFWTQFYVFGLRCLLYLLSAWWKT